MGKETTIKLSKEFKEVLRRQKQSSEDFEGTIKRLINQSSIPKKEQYTEKYTETEEEIEDDSNIIAQGVNQFGTPTMIRQLKGIPEIEEETKLCEEHNLPAQYDSFNQKWLCPQCRELEQINPASKIPY